MTELYPRHLASKIQESLLDTPVVLVNGPRQCGKTTLVKQFEAERAYFTLDDPGVLQAVRADPLGFVRRIDKAIIDEVQRVPELLMALKLVVDQDRRPGRFLLTGSANLMALPQIADSLAGRIESLTLLPLSQSELARRPCNFLMCATTQDWAMAAGRGYDSRSVEAQVLAGGYPEMQQRSSLPRKQAWARAYMAMLMERDIRDVAQIDQVHRVPQLLTLAAELSGQLLNLTQIGGQIGLNSKTVEKYIGILEKLFLVSRLPAWSRNSLSRLVKTPKIHFIDAGLQATLTRLSPGLFVQQRTRYGATLKTWVYGELRKMLTLADEDWFLSHYRDKDQTEVDFVLESAQRKIIGIEVKAVASVQSADFKGLKKLKEYAAEDFSSGIVLYDGDHVLPFGEGFWAVPLSWL